MLAVLLALFLMVGAARAQPQEQHMQAYRERLAFYQSEGFGAEEIVTRMTNYFPWFGARFGVEFDRGGNARYYVAIGHSIDMTFFAVINP